MADKPNPLGATNQGAGISNIKSEDSNAGGTTAGGKTSDSLKKGDPTNPGSDPTEGADQVELVQYTSHPIMNYRIGNDYVFEKGVLKLKPDEVERFEAVLAKQPIQIRNDVRKLDIDAANLWIAEIAGRRVAGVDTTANTLGPGATDGSFTK